MVRRVEREEEGCRRARGGARVVVERNIGGTIPNLQQYRATEGGKRDAREAPSEGLGRVAFLQRFFLGCHASSSAVELRPLRPASLDSLSSNFGKPCE